MFCLQTIGGGIPMYSETVKKKAQRHSSYNFMTDIPEEWQQ